MSTTPVVSKGRTRLGWTASHDAFLVEQLIEQQNIGKRPDKRLKREAWRAVLVAFNKEFGLQIVLRKLKGRIKKLREEYCLVKKFLDQNGFDQDDVWHNVTTADGVWNQYLLAHPEVKHFKKMSLPLYNELGIIFGGRKTTSKVQLSTIRSEPVKIGTRASGSRPAKTLPSEDFESSLEKEIPSEDSKCNRRRVATSTTMCFNKKMQISTERIANVLESMVSASESLTKPSQALMVNDYFPYAKCLEELQQLEGLEESELVLAVEVLKDENNAVAFMTLKGPLRLTWLRSKCHREEN